MSSLRFGGRRKVELIRQSEASECGLACIAMIANYHGSDFDLIALRRQFPTSLKGMTLKQLISVADNLGFSSRAMRGELSDLHHIALPIILHWDLSHFIVLERIRLGPLGPRYHIHDPASGTKIVSESEISRRFSGAILELVKTERFVPQSQRTPLKISQLWSKIDGFWPTIRQVFALSAVLQIAALAAPFFLQISIDTVLPANDTQLLFLLALGFAGVGAITVATTWVRSLVLLRLSTTLSYQVTVNLFRHLVKLPLPWFERRHVGDIISRFGSTKTISDLLSQGLIASAFDALMAIFAFALAFLYSKVVALVALAAVAIVAATRLGFYSALQRANVSVMSANARESSTFIETVRGIATLKAFGEEAARQQIWQHRKASAVNAEIKTGQYSAMFNAIEQAALVGERVIFVYISIMFVMKGDLSIGMIFALQSYRQQFLDAVTRVVQQLINFRLLDIHLMRIADIALSPAEASSSPYREYAAERPSLPAKLELRNVRFRYSINDPEILSGINLVLDPGEMVAIVGPSGGGKTTLLKIMLGLLPPTSGEILVDGQPLRSYGLARWRQEVGSVGQEDVLFAGSLAENIAMFDPEYDEPEIHNAAKAANIHDEISKMPMRYQTLVGDMGSVLSGGQRQRVMLARALYRKPRALLLDEATAHLDPDSERAICSMISSLPITRILIAHRAETLQQASRILGVRDGRCVELTTASLGPPIPER